MNPAGTKEGFLQSRLLTIPRLAKLMDLCVNNLIHAVIIMLLGKQESKIWSQFSPHRLPQTVLESSQRSCKQTLLGSMPSTPLDTTKCVERASLHRCM